MCFPDMSGFSLYYILLQLSSDLYLLFTLPVAHLAPFAALAIQSIGVVCALGYRFGLFSAAVVRDVPYIPVTVLSLIPLNVS